MMDIAYFSAQIAEELDGAIAYAKKAIEEEDAHWASSYFKMSNAEAEHAALLTSIFDEQCSRALEDASEDAKELLKDIRASMMSMYAETLARLKSIQEIYKGGTR